MLPEITSINDMSSLELYEKVVNSYIQRLLKIMGIGIFDPTFKVGLRFWLVVPVATLLYLTAMTYSVIVLWNESKLSVLESFSTIAVPTHVSVV